MPMIQITSLATKVYVWNSQMLDFDFMFIGIDNFWQGHINKQKAITMICSQGIFLCVSFQIKKKFLLIYFKRSKNTPDYKFLQFFN